MSSSDKYTDPELREEVKEEVKQGDKGGQPGQWSARKAQMMASEYKKRGGGYTTDEKHKDDRQKHLDNWTEEEWQTKEGSGSAKQDDGSEKRYLPKAAWEQMDEQEKQETDAKKLEESREGKQHVGNTAAAKQARRKASLSSKNDNEETAGENHVPTLHKEQSVHSSKTNSTATKSREGSTKEEKTEGESEARGRAQEWAESNDDQGKERRKDTASGQQEGEQKQTVPQKRSAAEHNGGASEKKQRRDSKDEPRGTAGDKNRVPQKGQQVQWHSLPGYVDGEVVEVAYEEKTVEGKTVKASENDPRIVLKTASTGKIAVHKPQAVYF